MDLNFEKKEQYWGKDAAWVSEFEVTSDFNLHVERISGGRFLVYQKTVKDGKYAICDGLGRQDHKDTIDITLWDLVYPKYIKVVSEAEVTYAAVTTDGEIGTGGNGGGENDKELKRNDVNFFDYDGTLLYAYSWEEAKELTELPALPEHDGLEVREWNYTLEDIKAQGVKCITPEGDYPSRLVGELTIDGVTYLAWNEYGNYAHGYSAYLTTGEPKEGDVSYYAWSDDGYEWEIEINNDGKYYEYKIIEVADVIGKADVGACVYDSEGEQVLEDFVFIIPRGVEYFDSTIYGTAITVLSIPNTVVEGRSQRISYCNIFGEVKIPISFVPTGANAYSFIVGCKVDSIYINGVKPYSDGYYYRIVFRDIYRSQSTFAEEGTIGNSINSNYIKIHPSVNSVYNIELYYNNAFGFVILDFSNHKFIPECISYPFVIEGCTIIVPDELYDEWIDATNWSEIKWYIYPASKCKNIIRE